MKEMIRGMIRNTIFGLSDIIIVQERSNAKLKKKGVEE
ncbi:unnamed protein product [Chironomus riparius]|uniref:Uncharacterized protein n=1 Tax=Chironomus riparius TaxID=315576 RepID=A0A9N9WVG3_9DIPT|nr:unnamed protein product [Chironomus riparius]